MNVKPGQWIVVESETVGTPTREGEILEIIQGQVSVRYRVRWADGHESIFSPSGGAAKVLGGPAGRAGSPGPKPAQAKRSQPKLGATKGTRAKR